MTSILTWYHLGQEALRENASFAKISQMKIRERIGRMKYIVETDFEEEYEAVIKDLKAEYQAVMKGDDLYA